MTERVNNCCIQYYSHVNAAAGFSSLVAHLTGAEKARYEENVKELSVGDPYMLPPRVFTPVISSQDNVAQSQTVAGVDLPNITYGDIYICLINRTSTYTNESLKGYKSLDAYKYFVAGFVQNVQITRATSDKVIITAKVCHSQRLNEPPLKLWVASCRNGEIISSHCTCKAGLGEVCSHVAATLFYMEAVVKRHHSTACTSMPCEWIVPSRGKGHLKQVTDMDFTSVTTKKNKLTEQSTTACQATATACPPMTEEEVEACYLAIQNTGVKSGFLSLTKDYARHYVPAAVSVPLPQPLTLLRRHNPISVEELNQVCDDIFTSLTISVEEATALEKLTRQQWKSRLWYDHRAGRITPSKFKAACRTSVANPSKSLLKQICYPHATKCSTKATRWGCKTQHQQLKVVDSGLHIIPQYPYLGATSDGLVECLCCRKGVLEIKCPHCKRGKSLNEAAEDGQFCLERIGDKFSLKKNHAYYYQVQGQMLLTGVNYCDFVV
ncbi:uncharacterized protein LOC143224004 [Tachypleus tridentatus]|uniref:uncharacterized protein LOC143224004 n=1 Tax=Tachypleus tridentatus TaxID=6853 RepID=UPI003FD4C213